MVPHSILDKCTTQEKAEVLEWWRVTSEAVNRERVRSQVIKIPVVFKDLATLLDVIQDSPEDLAELRKHTYALKDAVSKVVRRKSRQHKNQENATFPEEKLTYQLYKKIIYTINKLLIYPYNQVGQYTETSLLGKSSKHYFHGVA